MAYGGKSSGIGNPTITSIVLLFLLRREKFHTLTPFVTNKNKKQITNRQHFKTLLDNPISKHPLKDLEFTIR